MAVVRDIALSDKAAVTIARPDDPALRTLFGLAEAKFEARTGAPASTRADWNAVTQEYNALTSKARGPLSQIVREFCEKAPGGD